MADLRRAGRSCDTDYAGRSLKGQLTQAQRLGAGTIVVADAAGFTFRRRGEEDRRLESLEEVARELA
jgi:histidyl-tRNA synthetase